MNGNKEAYNARAPSCAKSSQATVVLLLPLSPGKQLKQVRALMSIEYITFSSWRACSVSWLIGRAYIPLSCFCLVIAPRQITIVINPFGASRSRLRHSDLMWQREPPQTPASWPRWQGNTVIEVSWND